MTGRKGGLFASWWIGVQDGRVTILVENGDEGQTVTAQMPSEQARNMAGSPDRAADIIAPLNEPEADEPQSRPAA